MIPYGRQSISDEDVAAVVRVLRSDFLTQGPEVPRFEQAVRDYTGAGHALAFNSATSALHAACLALGVGPGDRVWTSPNTFVASANCARYCGATVDFVDIDPETLNLGVAALAAKLEAAAAASQLPKVVIAVDFAGEPCDLRAMRALLDRYGPIRLIEDASHAIGGRYADRPIGAGEFSDITIFSFHPVKLITTAEGGMALTNDAALAEAMALFRSHGITRDAAKLEADEGPWYYEQQTLGYNYRMTELQAALGTSQLTRLDAWVARRHELAAQYDRALAGLPLKLPRYDAAGRSALHLYPVQLQGAAVGRRVFFERLRARGIGVNVHYIPVHRQPDYRQLGFRAGDFPCAEAYYANAVSLPMYADLSDAQQAEVVTAVKGSLQS